MNKCVFEKLVSGFEFSVEMRGLIRIQGLKKEIPDTPKGEVPVHERKHQMFAHHNHMK